MAASISSPVLSAPRIEQLRFRRHLFVAGIVIALVLVFARLVLALQIAAPAVLMGCVALGLIVARRHWGLYVALALVLFFDGMSGDPIMVPGWYVFTSLQTTFHLAGGIVIPFEMLLLLVLGVWLAHGAMSRRLEFRDGAFGRTVLLFTLALGGGVVRGVAAGGNVNFMFWESRFLFSMVVVYVLASNLIRTRAHVRALITVIMVAGSASIIEAIYRKYVVIPTGAMGSAQELWFSHDGTVFWGIIVTLVVAQQVFGAPRWQRIFGPLLAVATLFTMLISERRAGLVAVVIALAFMVIALYKIKRKAFFAIGIPAVVIMAIYLPLFWNNEGTLGQGARAIRSIYQPDPRDAASNAWRDLEAINVRATIASDPLVGIGFGRPFLQVVTVPDISEFQFWDYEAHHDILWVWLKTGAIGFILFFTLILGVIARSIWLARTLPHAELKVFAIVGMTGVIMSVVFCYVDLGLTGSRIPLLLGLLSGTVGVLDQLRD